MQEQLITFETAKLAKEKGFIECVINYYHIHEGLTEPVLIDEINILLKNYKRPYEVRKNCNTVSTEFGYIENFSAPTQSLLQKWLREVHNIYVEISFNQKYENTRFGYIVRTQSTCFHTRDFSYKTYEEALEIGLQEGLKLILK